MIVDVSVLDERWQCLGDLDAICESAVAAVLDVAADAPCGEAEMSVAFADDTRVAELNETYRGKKGATNVLSFPSGEAIVPAGLPKPLGDVILSFETVLRESREQGKTFENHSCHLIVHGFLHLLGYDHVDVADAREMEGFEIAALAKLNIPNPYEAGV